MKDLMFYKAFGRKVRILREPLMSQELLASALGMSRTNLVNIEAGRQQVSIATANAIARRLGVRLADLLGEE